MKLNQKLLEQLRNGEIAVENSGTLEQLREVLKAAFPWCSAPYGHYNYYIKDEIYSNAWCCLQYTHIPTVKISDFYQPELFTGWAKDDNHPKWMGYIKNDVAVFGFNSLGVWMKWGVNGCVYSEDPDSRPATNEEIEKHLTEEAKRRGYKGGDTIKGIHDTTHWASKISSFYYDAESDSLVTNESCVVYEKGQWAEIVYKPQAIHYLVNDMKYSFSYQELKHKYQAVVNYSDELFMDNLPEIAHLACIVCYVKGLGNNDTIGDKGIIHEIIHLMTGPNEPTNDLQEIRDKFNKLIKLS